MAMLSMPGRERKCTLETLRQTSQSTGSSFTTISGPCSDASTARRTAVALLWSRSRFAEAAKRISNVTQASGGKALSDSNVMHVSFDASNAKVNVHSNRAISANAESAHHGDVCSRQSARPPPYQRTLRQIEGVAST